MLCTENDDGNAFGSYLRDLYKLKWLRFIIMQEAQRLKRTPINDSHCES